MANTLVNAAIKPGQSLETIYTVPALKSAVLYSAIYSQEPVAGTATVTFAVLRSGQTVPDNFVSDLSVAQATAVNVMAAKVSLMAGDSLQVRNSTAWPFVKRSYSGFSISANVPSVFLSNPAGTTLVSVTETTGQIYTSTDSGATWTLTRNPSPAVSHNTGIYFGGYFYLYTSASLYIRSADGITWSSPAAATLAPFSIGLMYIVVNSAAIVNVGGTLYYQNAGQMYSSTDAITWATYGVAMPTGAYGLCWTGTRWIAASSTGGTGNTYWSTNGAVWTTVASGSATNASGYTPLASDGAGVVMLMPNGGSGFISFDHGSTWAASGISSHGTYPAVAYLGNRFVTPGASTSTVSKVLSSALSNVVYNSVGYSGAEGSGSYSVRYAQSTGAVYLITRSGGLYKSEDLNFTPRGGAGGFVASMMEVS